MGKYWKVAHSLQRRKRSNVAAKKTKVCLDSFRDSFRLATPKVDDEKRHIKSGLLDCIRRMVDMSSIMKIRRYW